MSEIRSVTRRQFIRHLTVAGSAVLVAPIAACSHEASTLPQPASPPAEVTPGPNSAFVAAGPVSEFTGATPKVVRLPDGSPAAIWQKSGKWVALSARCTHRGCTVGFDKSAEQFVCPCHGGRFDLTGNNVSGPPPSPLPALAVKVQNGQVMVQG